MNESELFDVSIFIITKNNEIIPIPEYEYDEDVAAEFIMLTNDSLNSEQENNSICINKDLSLVTQTMKWSYKDYLFKSGDILDSDCAYLYKHIKQHVSGYRSTINMMNESQEAIRYYNKISALQYTTKSIITAVDTAYTKQITFQGKCYHGYLPAIGQLMYISKNLLKIYQAMHIAHISKYKSVLTYNKGDGEYTMEGLEYFWHSSTQGTRNDVYMLFHGRVEPLDKRTAGLVLPLFAL